MTQGSKADTDLTLYCYAQSGNSYKAALMLNLCGADWTPRFVDYFNGETRTPEFRAINEMGEVPILVDDDLTLSQSGVILDYLAAKFGRFGPSDDAERREVLRWMLFDNHKLTGYTGTLRLLRTYQKTGETPVTEFLHDRATKAWSVLDGQLADRDFVAAERPTIADISLVGYLYWPDEIGIAMEDYPRIAAWTRRIAELPGWVHPYELMPGYPIPGNA